LNYSKGKHSQWSTQMSQFDANYDAMKTGVSAKVSFDPSDSKMSASVKFNLNQQQWNLVARKDVTKEAWWTQRPVKAMKDPAGGIRRLDYPVPVGKKETMTGTGVTLVKNSTDDEAMKVELSMDFHYKGRPSATSTVKRAATGKVVAKLDISGEIMMLDVGYVMKETTTDNLVHDLILKVDVPRQAIEQKLYSLVNKSNKLTGENKYLVSTQVNSKMTVTTDISGDKIITNGVMTGDPYKCSTKRQSVVGMGMADAAWGKSLGTGNWENAPVCPTMETTFSMSSVGYVGVEAPATVKCKTDADCHSAAYTCEKGKFRFCEKASWNTPGGKCSSGSNDPSCLSGKSPQGYYEEHVSHIQV